jgi:3-oxoacyl-[acyl-carrier protein] reductase
MKLSGKVALVTGGGSGIGRSIVERLVEDGARVIAVGRRTEPLDALTKKYPGKVSSFSADVTKSVDARKAVAFALQHLARLDILVNNAGAFVRKPLGETSDDEILAMLDVNVRGPLSFCREAAPHLEAHKGCIINISSAAGIYARPQLIAYGTAKAALHHATKLLAVELGPRAIRVNALAPGLIRSEMTDPILADPARTQTFISLTALGRVGEPDDVAAVVSFLASDDARWITGQTIAVSGGLLL